MDEVRDKGSVSRREFLKMAGVAGAAVSLGGGLAGFITACGGEEATTTTTAAAATTTTAMAGATTTTAATTGNAVKLRVLYVQAPAGTLLQQFADEYKKMNPNVSIEVDMVPAGQWLDTTMTQFASPDPLYEACMPDSQWIGQLSEAGHVLDITDWLKANIDVAAYVPTLFSAYSQYPQRDPGTTGGVDLENGKFWGVPLQADCAYWAYRKDLFEDPKEKDAFKAKYGYDLAVPATWKQMLDISEFFTRPAEKFYGLAYQATATYDGIAGTFNQQLWTAGGELWDPKTLTAEGFINGDKGKQALTFLVDLFKFCPPGSANYWWDEVNTAFTSGTVAMAQNWFTFAPALLDPRNNSLGTTKEELMKKVGFFLQPPVEAGGSYVIAMGGQGLSVSSHLPEEKKAAMLDFLKWFHSKETQWEWAKAGGATSRADILASDEYKALTPWNSTAAASYPYVRDFWNIPIYGQMLDVMGKNLNAAIIGAKSVDEALNTIAAEQQKQLDDYEADL